MNTTPASSELSIDSSTITTTNPQAENPRHSRPDTDSSASEIVHTRTNTFDPDHVEKDSRDASQVPSNRPVPSRTPSNEHESLKYHLLGPSLTKAGQDSVDQSKVSEIIYNASKGSKYFNNEEVKDKNLSGKIDRILARKRQLEKLDLSHELRRADDYIAELELGRDLSQIVVHIDCDAFYAAVEELDNPHLRDVPMAVGKGVLTTCNYHARKFGCRSGMAGFVAMKLCPQLICLPLNFVKYTAKAEEVRTVLAEYDPRFESASCDEAYLNLTQYCAEHHLDPEEAVSQLREDVHRRTKITVSAGIAANAKIAKICSNRNKPNGQFRVASDRQTILDFMKTLPTRKVNGVGRVFERELDAIGIKTCGDIYAHRAFLSQLFGQKAFQFLMQCYLGLGRTKIQPAEDYERKSVGTETTFRDIGSPDELREKLRYIAGELEGDLKRTEYKGRTLCIKIKLHTYEVYTRQMSPPFAIHLAEDLYKYSLPMLEKLMKEIPNMKLRLMGLRVTHIISTKKPGIDFFGRHRVTSVSKPAIPAKNSDDGEWEVWPEAEFEEAARQERDDEMNELEKLSQEQDAITAAPSRRPPALESKESTRSDQAETPIEEPQEEHWICPICSLPQSPDDTTFNSHIDYCLSRQTIKEAVKETTPSLVSPQKPQASSSSVKPVPSSKKGKRGRSKNEASGLDKDREKRRAFFFAQGPQ
ncbi:DNA-directed polymeras-like protein kappa [Aaosphaeria arxii CBS 175.79]|uniref:DNA polymerase kappa n=1 Tax=Aaosphaeria arxii CBS 175.79 TaxID=1450172 RepID=A0A6A5YAG0_9PLEO|nr:DNA-directed polymeras-like protein kappa [Aaosphaeria arxii CBS 175.79]KAF2022007.1 DNA-directed polymeras-like protein kappa [Aaosphaeria arxii CBS 175.79]